MRMSPSARFLKKVESRNPGVVDQILADLIAPLKLDKRKKLLADITHVEVQLGRLAKTCRDMRAEVLSLTTEE